MSGFAPFNWLRALVGPPRRPPTQLSDQQALEIARTAADRAGVTEPIEVMGVRVINGRFCWIVGTAIKDAGWSVLVDDATGEASRSERWNGWTHKN